MGLISRTPRTVLGALVRETQVIVGGRHLARGRHAAHGPSHTAARWWLAVGHLITGAMLCLTIIGIPLGLASFKIIPITLMPLGVRIVPADRVSAYSL